MTVTAQFLRYRAWCYLLRASGDLVRQRAASIFMPEEIRPPAGVPMKVRGAPASGKSNRFRNRAGLFWTHGEQKSP